jgi:hypothetical protein
MQTWSIANRIIAPFVPGVFITLLRKPYLQQEHGCNSSKIVQNNTIPQFLDNIDLQLKSLTHYTT